MILSFKILRSHPHDSWNLSLFGVVFGPDAHLKLFKKHKLYFKNPNFWELWSILCFFGHFRLPKHTFLTISMEYTTGNVAWGKFEELSEHHKIIFLKPRKSIWRKNPIFESYDLNLFIWAISSFLNLLFKLLS